MVQIFNNEDIMFLIFKSAFFPINQTRLLSKVSLMYLQISGYFYSEERGIIIDKFYIKTLFVLVFNDGCKRKKESYFG